MKKYLIMILALAMTLSLAACGNGKQPGEGETKGETKEPVTTEAIDSEPFASEPVSSEPVSSEPVSSESSTAEPETAEPSASESESASPETSEPVTSKPKPETSKPQPKPEEPDSVYTGVMGGDSFELAFFGDTVKMIMLEEKNVVDAEELAGYGVSGTVTISEYMILKMTVKENKDGILSAQYTDDDTFLRFTFSGNGAKAYKDAVRAEAEQLLDEGDIDRESYEMTLAVLDGEEIPVSYTEEGVTGIVTLKLVKSTKKCGILSVSEYANDEVQYTVEYNEDGNVVRSHDVRWGTELYEYHTNGKKKKQESYTAAGILEWSEECDEKGRTVKESYYDENGELDYYCTYEYHANGERKKLEEYNAEGNLQWSEEYDEEGKAVKETYYDENGNPEYYCTYEYHADGERKKQAEYNAEDILVYLTEYNEDGNIVKRYDFEWGTELYEYHANGETKNRKKYNAEGVLEMSEEYNENGDSVKGSYYDENGELDYYYTYEYHANGNLKKVSCYNGDGSLESVEEYDEDGNPIGDL